MHRSDDPAARDEGAEDAQKVGKDDEDHVPGFQHPAPFLDHDGVQESRAGEPGHQRGILHGVPSPITAPAKDDISPLGAQQQTGSQQEPGCKSPAAHGADPGESRLSRDERGHCKGERDDETYKPQILDRGVDDHGPVLKERVQALTVGGDIFLHGPVG